MESIQRVGVSRSERQSSVELIKIIAILLIVCSHVVQTLESVNTAIPYQDYVVNLSIATTDISRIILTMLRYSGALGNTVFFICSAWYLLDSKSASKEKIITMLLDIWVISVMTFFAVFFLRQGNIPIKTIIKSFFPTLFANNWYLTCYLLFYPIHPILNKNIYSMSQKKLLRISLFLGTLYIGFNYINGFFFPSALILWVSIYFVVAYTKLYMPRLSNSIKANVIALLVGIAGNCGIIIATNVLGLHIPFFENKLLHWNNNCSPFLIIIALSMLNLARQVHFSSRVINYLSKLSLLIYIVHENLLLRTYYRPMMWHYIYTTFGYNHILLWVLVIIVVVFMFGFIVSAIYSFSIQKATKSLSKWISTALTGFYEKVERELLKIS